MPRKRVQGPIRDKEKTKEKLLNAVGEILMNKGFQYLKISSIAETAEVDKKLIYEYFGGLDELLNEFISSKDYWSNADAGSLKSEFEHDPKSILKNIVHQQFNSLNNNKELSKILLWELAEKHPLLRKISNEREEKGENLFQKFIDPYFEEDFRRFRAIFGLLIGGVYYYNIYGKTLESNFGGINLESEKDIEAIHEGINFILDAAFQDRENKKSE